MFRWVDQAKKNCINDTVTAYLFVLRCRQPVFGFFSAFPLVSLFVCLPEINT